jgi:hypothetical protein
LTEKSIEYVEDGVPMEGIAETAAIVVTTYGGVITARQEDGFAFNLPRRQGVSASGFVECLLVWKGDDATLGTLTLTSGEEVTAPRPQLIALLVVGVIGAVLWTLWPFFPNLGPLAWIGGALAIAAYMLAARRTPRGIVYMLLRNIAEAQREKEEGELLEAETPRQE